MAAVGKRCVDKTMDNGLRELLVFIKYSLIGDRKCERSLVTDRDYQFTIYTQVTPKETDRLEVKISQGTVLHLFTQSGLRSSTNIDVFMVDDGDGAWYIDTATGQVKHFAKNIYVSSPLASSAVTLTTGIR